MIRPALIDSPTPSQAATPAKDRRWSPRSIGLIVLVWLILHVGGLFSPGLLDDVDSVYLEIAREMLVRHDFVTPYIDGIRFFDKPPLLYWLAAASMRVFGVHDWAGRLPLALLTLALLLATYALGLRLLAAVSPARNPDRAALYAAVALGTSLGPYLYTRFFIPDIALTLWTTLGVHFFLIAVGWAASRGRRSALLPMLAFAAVLAANVLTKGLVGFVLVLGFALLYLVLTRQLRLLPRLFPLLSTAVFLGIAAPWHLLAAMRNPAVPLPARLGLPAHAGWAWFYLYNEHIARFLSRRVPHDYGQVPVPLFWLLALLWLFPWITFLPAGLRQSLRGIRPCFLSRVPLSAPCTETSLTPLLWATLVLGFFTLSARQEYYSLPALPALAFMIGAALARADRAALLDGADARDANSRTDTAAQQSILRWSLYLLVPFATLAALVGFAFAVFAPTPPRGASLASLLAQHPDAYNLSLGHLFDLTGPAMGLFRGPLCALGLGMLTLGPAAYVFRRRARTAPANATVAVGATILLLCMHQGLTRFYPILGSKELAASIVRTQQNTPRTGDVILIDGELTAGSSLLFYTQEPVRLVNGRVNGPWFGSFWPDAPPVFETDGSLRQLWSSPRRVFLLTYHAVQRRADLAHFGRVSALASEGGKTVLTNQP